MGHFLCLDRWGQPSAAESAMVCRFTAKPRVLPGGSLSQPSIQGDKQVADCPLLFRLPGLEVTRHIRLSTDAAFFVVTERVTNRNKLGRIYNMVQHPSIAPPFLDEKTS